VHNCPNSLPGPGGDRKLPGRVLKPGQANEIAKWAGYESTNQISAGGSRIWMAGRGVKGPKYIAEDMTGHMGGIFKGAKKPGDLMSTGKDLRLGSYDVGDTGGGKFGLVWMVIRWSSCWLRSMRPITRRMSYRMTGPPSLTSA
jgi:hypothetical protein